MFCGDPGGEEEEQEEVEEEEEEEEEEESESERRRRRRGVSSPCLPAVKPTPAWGSAGPGGRTLGRRSSPGGGGRRESLG